MDSRKFNNSRAGDIFEYEKDGERVSTFVPEPLPPEIRYDQETVKLIEDAASNLNDLKGTGRNLPDPNIFIRPYILKEAVLSSQIEGTQTSFEEAVVRSESGDLEPSREARDLEEVRNYVEALNYGLERLNVEPLTVDLIKRIHEKLMSGVRGKDRSPGQFREKQVHIGEVGVSREDAEYVPMAPEKISSAMEDLVDFMNEDRGMPYLVKSALIHYQFEAIHPFEDGNGRMGRLLIIIDMIRSGKLSQPLLYLSEYFNNNRGRYYDKLLRVSRDGEYEEWIDFFLRAVKTQSSNSTSTAVKILEKREKYKQSLRQGEVPENCVVLMENVFDLRPRTITQVAEELGVKYHAARNYVNVLVEHGVLEQRDKKGREKQYVAGELLRMMEEESSRVETNVI
ncbi:Fic family protein [Candidatus Nanohalococcus occultus]|uniref:Transciptional regulator, contains Ficand DeoR-like domains n=1 Tax=Candidatus Nanohalococcus occultus TaxID=2978047 RepID=A0ABY8CF68_9ARCH|nr:Putative transciptional regulator, contains Ficand DeoR-like domains [Candidatus Nanohaloarchaeota archaeon SVXNc]